jgi:hypothetical protein
MFALAELQRRGQLCITAMADTVENLILDLLEWTARKERTYRETMDAWRTSCPGLRVWEDATGRGLVETTFTNGSSMVRVTQAGFDLLQKRGRAVSNNYGRSGVLEVSLELGT